VLTARAVPWALYHSARPRHAASAPDKPAHELAAARSELRALELLALALALASPALGAVLLQHVSALVLGPAALSWFSTGLFVLATAVRPWSHLGERLSARADGLQTLLHEPAPPAPADALAALQADLAATRERVEELADELAAAQDALADRPSIDDAHAAADLARADAQRALRAHERSAAAQRTSADARLAALEAALDALRTGAGAPCAHCAHAAHTVRADEGGSGVLAALGTVLPGWIRVSTHPAAPAPAPPAPPGERERRYFAPGATGARNTKVPLLSPSASPPLLSPPGSSATLHALAGAGAHAHAHAPGSPRARKLDTIHEGRAYDTRAAAPAPRKKMRAPRPRGPPSLAGIVWRCVDLALLPARVVLRALLPGWVLAQVR
jgi:hypothetical protein